MKAFTKQSLFALATVALLSSCSRPYATFQKTTPEHFYTKKTTVAPVAEAPAVAQAEVLPVEATPVIANVNEAPATAVAPASRPATVDAALDQLEAVASAKAGPVESHKVAKRVAKIRTMMSALPKQSSVNESSAAPKMNLMQRMVMKSIDKKILKHQAPDQAKKTMARSLLSIGIVVGLIGLLLILIGTGTVYSLGYVALVVGIILVIASLL